MSSQSTDAEQWHRQLLGGKAEALAFLFNHYRPRLEGAVRLRMDSRVSSRVDPADVLQEVYLDAARQLAGYIRQPKVSFYIWLRGIALQRLSNIHRQHLRAKKRCRTQELPLPTESSAILARQLLTREASPSQALIKDELQSRVQGAMSVLDASDREVILMRHFETMSNGEVAQALGLSDSGATMRYGRALVRLKEILLTQGDGEESKP